MPGKRKRCRDCGRWIELHVDNLGKTWAFEANTRAIRVEKDAAGRLFKIFPREAAHFTRCRTRPRPDGLKEATR